MAASIVCALVVAALWGGNIGVLLPLVEVVANNQSLSQRVDKVDRREPADDRRNIAPPKSSSNGNWHTRPPTRHRRFAASCALAVARREAAETDLHRLAVGSKPWIDAYLPDDPFRTLVVIVVLLLVATIVKDTFLTSNTFLVNRLSHLATFDLRKQFFRRTLRMDLATFNESGTSDLL